MTLVVFGGLAFLAGIGVAPLVATTFRRTLVLLGVGAGGALVAYLVADARGAFDIDPQCSGGKAPEGLPAMREPCERRALALRWVPPVSRRRRRRVA